MMTLKFTKTESQGREMDIQPERISIQLAESEVL